MRRFFLRLVPAIIITLVATAFSVPDTWGQSLRFARLGDFTLENGQIIRDCKIGYRTFGHLNADSSNAVLFPTWFGGTSAHVANHIGPGKLIDSTKYFVIVVDALGNGVSSSPSNSVTQPGKAFPLFTIRDMVHSQYQLLTHKLGLRHLYGMIGGSMGGMQVFEWIVSYPDFVERAVSYVGSPRLTSFDLLLWETELRVIRLGERNGNDREGMLKVIAALQSLMIRAPEYFVGHISREEFPEYLATIDSVYSAIFEPDNWASQLRAMMAHNVSAPFGGDMGKAAMQVKAKTFIIVSATDHIVNPVPALQFAELIGAQTLILKNNCGHLAVGCELKRVARAVDTFFSDKGTGK